MESYKRDIGTKGPENVNREQDRCRWGEEGRFQQKMQREWKGNGKKRRVD